MSDSPKFVAVTDKATNRIFYVLLTSKQEAELPAATPAPVPAPYSPPPAGEVPSC